MLKSFIFTFILIALPAQAEMREVCGGYQSEDYGDRVIYSITDFKSSPGMPVYYSIQNPGVEASLTLLRGACYCVKGDVKSDYEFFGDSSYKVLQLSSLIGQPTFDCWPK